MKRILIMDSGSFHVFGGAATTAYDTYSYLKKFWYKVDVYADLSKIDPNIKRVTTQDLEKNFYDIVLLNSIRDVPIVMKHIKPKSSSSKFIYTDRGNVLHNFKQAKLKKFLPKMLARQYLMLKMKSWLDCYVALSADQYHHAKDFFKKDTRITFIPNWSGKEFKKIVSIKKKSAAIFVGRLDERQKKVRFLILGIHKVVSEHKNLRKIQLLSIVGEGPDKEQYKDLVKELGLEDNIRFYGFVSRNQLIRLYNSSPFFVSTSEWEGMAGTFVEAMACGLPLLLNERNNTSLVSLPKAMLMSDGYNGLEYKQGNLEDFARNFYKLYTNHALRRKLADNSYKLSKNFSMETNLEKYRRIIEEL